MSHASVSIYVYNCCWCVCVCLCINLIEMLKRCERQTLIAAHTLRWWLLIGGCNRLQQGTVCMAAKQCEQQCNTIACGTFALQQINNSIDSDRYVYWHVNYLHSERVLPYPHASRCPDNRSPNERPQRGQRRRQAHLIDPETRAENLVRKPEKKHYNFHENATSTSVLLKKHPAAQSNQD